MSHAGRWRVAVLLGAGIGVLVSIAVSADDGAMPETSPGAEAAMPCGPQVPRDIAVSGGTNPVPVPGDGTRPPRLCSVHFHLPAEHTGIAACPAAGVTPAAAGEGVCAPHHGASAGEAPRPVRPGDEIEFHHVYTNCQQLSPPPTGLANCVCDRPQDGPDPMVLMVVAQKYVVAAGGDGDAAAALPEPAGAFARYGGSTTGPAYGSGRPDDPLPCSPFRVQWVVSRECRPLPISTLAAWCRDNPWDEDHAHGSREVISREDWLAPYAG